MNNEKIQLETKTISESDKKKRKLNTTWTVGVRKKPYTELDLKRLIKDRNDAFDRWCWDTGSDEDLELINELDEEITEARDDIAHQKLHDEIIEEYTNRVRNEIDKEILKSFGINQDE